MKRLFILFISFFVSTVLLAQPLKKVVIETTRGTGVDEGVKEVFMNALEAGLNNSDQFVVLANRYEYEEKIQGEMDAMGMGLIDPKQWAEFGRASGADMVVYAKIATFDQQYLITVGMVEVESGISKKTIAPLLATRAELALKAVELATILADGGVSDGNKLDEKPEKPELDCHAFSDMYIDDNQIEGDWNTAVQSCKEKGPEWRLPTKEELIVICQDAQRYPNSYGSRWEKSTYWTSSRRNNYSVYTVDFSDCSATFESMTSTAYFRCIKSK